MKQIIVGEYSRSQIMQFSGALIAAVGFALIPWAFTIPGLQYALNALSQFSMQGGGLFMIIIAVAIIGMFISLKDARFKYSSAVTIIALTLYYITLPQNASEFLKNGIWITLVGALVHVLAITIFKTTVSNNDQS